jgi:hypothetical protein
MKHTKRPIKVQPKPVSRRSRNPIPGPAELHANEVQQSKTANVVKGFSSSSGPVRPPVLPNRKHPLTNDLTTYRVEKVVITPVIAQEILDHWNYLNRPIADPKYRPLITEIEGKRFRLENGEFIGFDTNGVMTDGQHRLQALIITETTMTLWVCFGVDPESRDTINRGARRTVADIFTMSSVDHAAPISRAIRLLWASDHDGFDYRFSGIKSGCQPTGTQALQYAKENYDELQKAVLITQELALRMPWRRLNSGVVIFLLVLLGRQDLEKAKLFLYQIKSGLQSPDSDNGLLRSSPVLLLREALTEDQTRVRKWTANHVLGLILKAWIAFRDQKHIKMLSIRNNEKTIPNIYENWDDRTMAATEPSA